MNELLNININQLKPGQLYLNEEKVKQVGSWFDMNSYKGFIEVIDYEKHFIVIDGHSRLFHAYHQGMKEISVRICNSFENQTELALYRACAKWCRTTGINHIKDLETRIIPAEQFRTLWIERCAQWMDNHESNELEVRDVRERISDAAWS